MIENTLNIQQQSFTLNRFPVNHFDHSLRAWDAADEYLISNACDKNLLSTVSTIAIVNDQFGMLTCVLQRLAPHAKINVYLDSHMSEIALRKNLSLGDENMQNIKVKNSLDIAEKAQTPADMILLKVPRTHSYLRYILENLGNLADHNTRIIAGGMVKLISKSVVTLFEQYLDKVHTSQAKKKARLIFSQYIPVELNHTHYKVIEDNQIPFALYNYANVFCQDQIDIGARLFLEHLPSFTAQNKAEVIDLGCGNGILGISMMQSFPEIQMRFVDESHMAIASARMTARHANVNMQNALFNVEHCLSDTAPSSCDVIICNPPFHQNNTVLDEIAWQMFKDALQTLRKGGELRIVGNRHLNHHAKLRKLFGNCETIASNQKFVILSAIKR